MTARVSYITWETRTVRWLQELRWNEGCKWRSQVSIFCSTEKMVLTEDLKTSREHVISLFIRQRIVKKSVTSSVRCTDDRSLKLLNPPVLPSNQTPFIKTLILPHRTRQLVRPWVLKVQHVSFVTRWIREAPVVRPTDPEHQWNWTQQSILSFQGVLQNFKSSQ